MTRPRLFVAGAAHMDRRGRVGGDYMPAASNPGFMREEVGGGGFNALRNAMRHGVTASLLSMRGGDPGGEAVARAIVTCGCEDLSAVFLDRTTPSYTALLDADGELIAGLADMGLYEAGFARQMRRRKLREAILAAEAVLCDANLPADDITALVGRATGRPIYAIAVSPAKAVRVGPSLRALSCLFMNLREARALVGDRCKGALELANALGDQGLARGVITAGGETLTGFDADGLFSLAVPKSDTVVDVTGAGDALAGVTVAYLMRGTSLREAVRHGVAAATLTISNPSVIADYSDDAFAAALALVGDASPVA